jgi:hypothetical protein
MNESAADPVRRIVVAPEPHQEWLVANGLGGYASGTVLGVPTRRYHGLLIAALPNPAGRVMMLNSLPAQLRLGDGRRVGLGWAPPSYTPQSSLDLVDFKLELGLPVWRYSGFGVTVEKRIVVSYQTNTTMITYRVLEGQPLRLELRPAVQFRGHDDPVSTAVPEAYPLTAFGSRIEVEAPNNLPKLKLISSATAARRSCSSRSGSPISRTRPRRVAATKHAAGCSRRDGFAPSSSQAAACRCSCRRSRGTRCSR